MATNPAPYYQGQANPIRFRDESDPAKAFRNERMRSAAAGDDFDEVYRQQAQKQGGLEDRYRSDADAEYLKNLGYSDAEIADIIQRQDLMNQRISPQDAEAAARWTPEEEEAYRGDPTAGREAYNRDWLIGIPEHNARNLRGAVSEGAGRIRGSIDDKALRLSDEFSSQYPLSPEDVERLSMLTGREGGLQFQQEMDDLRARAAASGSTSPLAMATQQERLRKQQASAAAIGGLQGRLGAEDARREQLRVREQMRLEAEGRGTGLRLSAEENLLNQRLGAESEAGQMMERTGRYVTDVGMEQGRYEDAERSRRAGTVNDVRTGARIRGQEEPYRRVLETGDRLSGRTSQVADVRRAGEGERRGYYTNQQQQAADQRNRAEGGRLDAFAVSSGRSQGAAQGQLASRQPSWFNRNVTPYLQRAASTATSGGFSGGGASSGMSRQDAYDLPLAEGGIVSKPTRALIGEKGPEAVIPLSKLDKMRPKSSPIRLTINVQSSDSQPSSSKKIRAAA